MSTATVGLVKIAMEAWGEGDYELTLAFAHPHIRWDERPAEPDTELVWGRDEVERAMAEYLENFESYEAIVEELIDAGDRVVGVYRERGRLAGSGMQVNQTRAAVWTVDPKWIVDWTVYLSKREACAAAGLPPDAEGRALTRRFAPDEETADGPANAGA